VSGAAAKVALDRSVEQLAAERRSRETDEEREARERDLAQTVKEQQPVFEHLEACSERVLRAEIAIARRIAASKAEFLDSAKRDLRVMAEEVGECLLPEDEDVRRDRDAQLLDSRPQVVDALLSGDAAEIEAAFEVLAGPLVLYVRHYSNAIQMLPKLLLIFIGLPILLEQDLKLGDQCKEVVSINGRPFLPMSAWLMSQIVTDIAICITRARRYYLTAPVVRAFDRGEGVEATTLRMAKRAELFTSFLKHNLMKLGGKKHKGKPRAHASEDHGDGPRRRLSHRPGHLSTNEPRLRSMDRASASILPGLQPPLPRSPSPSDSARRVRSMSESSDAQSEDGSEGGPPHALDAVIPIEEASERGERALLALARVENSGTRVPLALLTILSFTLGLAGGVYLLLPFARDSCQPLALVLANSYIAFFYIFFVPNLLVVVVAIIEMSSLNPEDTRLREILERLFSRLDDIFFLGQIPLCVFVAKRLILKSTAPPLDGSRLRALLRRDAYILRHRRDELETALKDCDEQIAAVESIRRRARLSYIKKDTINPMSPAPALRVKRYSRYVPEVQWRQSFVPVYRELDPATRLDGPDPEATSRAGLSPLKFGSLRRLGSRQRAWSKRRDSDGSFAGDDEEAGGAGADRKDSDADHFFDAQFYD